jgi:hypothetical protein
MMLGFSESPLCSPLKCYVLFEWPLTFENIPKSRNCVRMPFFTEADFTDKDVAALLALVVQPNPGKMFPAEIAEVWHWFIWNGN